MMDIDPSPPLQQQQLQEDDDTGRKIAISRKRKNENSNDAPIKVPKLNLNKPIIYSTRKRKISDNDDEGDEIINIGKKQKVV